MKKLFLFFAMAVFGLLSSQTVPPYTIGDFRSKQSGEWTDSTSWERYTATGWTTTTSYPGKDTSTSVLGDYKAVVLPGHNITVSTNQSFYFGDLYILADPVPTPVNAATVTYGQVTLVNNGTVLSLLGDNQDVYIYGGIMSWSNNNTVLVVNLGSSIVLTNYNGAAIATGSNLLRPETAGDGCTGNQHIHFLHPDGTTVTQYAVCNGANSSYRFQDLNWGGGSIQAIPTASATEVCAGNTVQLSGSYSGYIPPDAGQVTYIWELLSGPAGYTFGPTAANATADQSVNLTIPGVYQFLLRAQYFSNTFNTYIYGQEYIEITVNALGTVSCACYKDPVLQTSTVVGEIPFPSKFGITSLGRAGNGDADNWPTVRESAHMVLESQTKGFVINRLTTAQLTAIETQGKAVDGMVAYDSDANCLKIYVKDTVNPANSGWFCFQNPACPDN